MEICFISEALKLCKFYIRKAVYNMSIDETENELMKKHHDIQTVDEAGCFVTDTNLIKYKIFSLWTSSITGMEGRVEKGLQL